MKISASLRLGCCVTVLTLGTWSLPSQAQADPDDTAYRIQAASAAKFIEKAATPETLNLLRQGGYTLYLRHGTTDNSRADRMPGIDLNDCSTQRPLTEGGRQLARQVGAAVRAAHIPIANNIYVSPLCRAKDTAKAAFPKHGISIDLKLMYTANLTDAQKVPIIANTRRLLSTPVAPGTNRLVIAHAPNLMDLMGYFPKEATLVVFRPRGPAGFDYVASIAPGLWAELLPVGALK